jgi:adenine deaminase
MKNVIGLGEVMDIEGVSRRRPDLMKKIGLFEGMPVDGHAPGLREGDLDLYMSAGIHSDHETASTDEGEEKLIRGMHLFVREGSAARDLDALAPLIRSEHLSRLSLCTDDLSVRDLFERGHLDALVSRLVRRGLPVTDALRLVTCNPALYFNLSDRNAPALGRKADLVIFERPEDMKVRATVKNGRIVYADGSWVRRIAGGTPGEGKPSTGRNIAEPAEGIAPSAMKVFPFTAEDFRQKATGRNVRVIGITDGSIITEDLSLEASIDEGYYCANPESDILLAYVFDRYRGARSFGFGFVRGFALKNGAIGATYAHDSHNLVIVGDNNEDIYRVFTCLSGCGGGLAASAGGRTSCIPMPHFGMISHLDAPALLAKETELDDTVRQMGTRLRNPFFNLSFLSLPVIPSLRLTAGGLFYVPGSAFVPVSND